MDFYWEDGSKFEPAFDALKQLFQLNRHVVTADKSKWEKEQQSYHVRQITCDISEARNVLS